MRSWENNKLLLTIKKYKILFCFLLIDIIAIICVSILSFQHHLSEIEKTSVISFNIVPSDSKIYINQKLCQTTLCDAKPGLNDIKISHDGLKSKTYQLKLKENNTTTINTFLNTSKQDFSFYSKKNHSIYLDELKKSSHLYKNDIKLQNYLNIMSIIDHLPINYSQSSYQNLPFISINISAEWDKCPHQNFCLNVTDVTGENTELAKQLIRNYNFNPDNYHIIYSKIDNKKVNYDK